MEKVKLRINPHTGRPYHVYKHGPGYRFAITVNGVRYRTITHPDMFTPALRAHTSEAYLNG